MYYHGNKMKNEKYHTVGTILKSNIKIVASRYFTHKYMTVIFSGLVQALDEFYG